MPFYQQSFVLRKRCGVCFLCILCSSDSFCHSVEDSPLHICIIKHSLSDKIKPRYTEINRMEITRSKQQTAVTIVPCDLYQNIHLWKTDMANNEKSLNSPASLISTKKTLKPNLSINRDHLKKRIELQRKTFHPARNNFIR